MPKRLRTGAVWCAGVAFIAACFFLVSPAAARASTAGPLLRVYLPLVSASPPAGLSSDNLIDAARTRGEITAEQALTYKVFAAFGDPRLPAQYHGDDSLDFDSHIVAEVQAVYPTLSAATQATLNPFLIPPAYVGSWAEPLPAPAATTGSLAAPASTPPACGALADWKSTGGAFARVWWRKSRPGDAAAAAGYLAALEGTIWPKLVSLMGRMPMPDGNVSCSGGDGRLDIYLDPHLVRSMAPAHNEPGCRFTPSYIVLNPAVPVDVLAHEFMHTIQWSYNTHDGCMYPGEYAWLAEATATWAQGFDFGTPDSEHYTADWFFPANQTPSLELKDDRHEYGAFLFLFFLSHHYSDSVIKTIWDGTQTTNSLDAINSAIPGGFDAAWPLFAQYNWDVPPFDFYKQWDSLVVQPMPLYGDDRVSGPGTWPMASDTPHLGLIYKHFTFDGTSARLVTFFNGQTFNLSETAINTMAGPTQLADGSLVYKMDTPPPDKVKGAKVQALYKVEGDSQWKFEDWTGRSQVSFCRDATAERLTELVVIFSNSAYQDRSYRVQPQGINSALVASDMPCWRFTGSGTAKSYGTGPEGTTTDMQTASNVIFERKDKHPDIPYPVLTFQTVQGTVHREYKVTGQCNGGGSGDAIVSPGVGVVNNLWTVAGVISGPSAKRYLGYADTGQPVTVSISCPNGSNTYPVPSLAWFEPTVLDAALHKIYTVPPGGTLTGNDPLTTGSNNSITFTWTLPAQRQ